MGMIRVSEGIYKRGDGQYQAKIQKKSYPKIQDTFPTLELAKEWRSAMLTDLIRGDYVKTKKIEVVTFGFCLKKYGEEESSSKKSERQELVIINRLIGNPEVNPPIPPHQLSKKLISEIEASDIEIYIKERRSQQSKRNPKNLVADATIRLEIMLMSSVFNFAIEKGYCRTNPVKSISKKSKLKPATARTRRFIGDEEQRLLSELDKNCRNRDIPLVVRFALATACRQSEIIGKAATTSRPATLGIAWEDINFEMRSITLHDTKNGKNRVITMGRSAYNLLKSLPRPITGGRVFNVTQDGLIRAMQLATKTAGIENFTFHCLRHEATSRMVEDGIPQAIVQKTTGHSGQEMMLLYTHVDTLKQSAVMR